VSTEVDQTNASFIRKIFPITVDYTLTPEQMLEAVAFDHFSPLITKDRLGRFSIVGSGTIKEDLFIVQFYRAIRSNEVIVELAKMNLEPARIEHALAFARTYRNLPGVYSIVFLGSQACGFVTGIYQTPQRQDFLLSFCDREWYDYYKFAAVRKR